jgi:SAM-dependent methyltransferase
MGEPSLKSSDSVAAADREIAFRCNICGRENRATRAAFDRELPSCGECGSTVRTRAVVEMISREMFGLPLALPDFPVLKGIRGIGISDSPDYAERLETKFSYRNTFYHKEPRFDIVDLPESEAGQYDFLIASEVFEHVAPPVERAFANAFRLLKPGGLFFFTVPYTLDERTLEHFPKLADYGIAQLSDRHVLVNRTADGQLEVFDGLVFHGGGGETLEIRRFTEQGLREQFAKAGFRSLQIYTANYSPFGIIRSENWSLPMTARKDTFTFGAESIAEIVKQSLERVEQLRADARQLKAKLAEYDEWVAWANGKMAEDGRLLEERANWALDLEKQLNERTDWAVILEKDVAHHTELAKNFQAESQDLRRELEHLKAELARMSARIWTRVGKAARFV